MALAQPLYDAGLVEGMLAGERDAWAAATAAPTIDAAAAAAHAAGPTASTAAVQLHAADRHAAPADGAIAIHALHVLLRYCSRSQHG